MEKDIRVQETTKLLKLMIVAIVGKCDQILIVDRDQEKGVTNKQQLNRGTCKR